MDKHAPIGVFDSGVGGISVLSCAVSMLPNERFVYYGDSKNAPYGTRNADEIFALSQNVMQDFLKKDIKALLIACNTVTAVVAERFRKIYPFPIVGMEPALKPAHALQKEGIVLVFATPMTLKSEKYHILSQKYGQNAFPVPAPKLVEFAEKGDFDNAQIVPYVRSLLAPFQGQKIDAVVLGCTHFPFLKAQIAQCLDKNTHIVDGHQATVKQLERLLQEKNLLSDTLSGAPVTFCTSGDQKTLELFKHLYAQYTPQL